MSGVIHVEALAIRNHHVARNAESRLFGALHVCVHPSHNAKSWKHTQPNEGHYLPGRTSSGKDESRKMEASPMLSTI